jgi:hypothetical protein
LIIITLLLSLKGAAAAAGSIDVVVPAIRTGVTANVVQNATANAGGPGGLLNNYIITVPTGWPFACVSFQNKSSNSLSFSMLAFTSLDNSASSFTGNTSWTQVSVQGIHTYTSTNGTGFAAAANSTALLLTRIAGAGKITLVPISINHAETNPVSVYLTLNNTGQCGIVDWSTVYFQDVQAPLTTTKTVNIIGPDSSFSYFNDLSTVTSCQIILGSSSSTGSPTLNVYIAANDINSGQIDDRISFTQLTTTAASRTALLSQFTSVADRVTTQYSLGAATEQPGLITGGLNVRYTVAGSGAAYASVSVYGVCKR